MPCYMALVSAGHGLVITPYSFLLDVIAHVLTSRAVC